MFLEFCLKNICESVERTNRVLTNKIAMEHLHIYLIGV